MRTPSGRECKFFYGDYFRGRSHEECRLLASASPPLTWRQEYCRTCPVPGILLANACPNMNFVPELPRQIPTLKKQVRVKVSCGLSGRQGFDPHIGCGECHPLPSEFTGDLD